MAVERDKVDRYGRKVGKVLLALVDAIYAGDTDLDRAGATDAALADPEADLACYRAIANERGPAWLAKMPPTLRWPILKPI